MVMEVTRIPLVYVPKPDCPVRAAFFAQRKGAVAPPDSSPRCAHCGKRILGERQGIEITCSAACTDKRRKGSR